MFFSRLSSLAPPPAILFLVVMVVSAFACPCMLGHIIVTLSVIFPMNHVVIVVVVAVKGTKLSKIPITTGVQLTLPTTFVHLLMRIHKRISPFLDIVIMGYSIRTH